MTWSKRAEDMSFITKKLIYYVLAAIAMILIYVIVQDAIEKILTL